MRMAPSSSLRARRLRARLSRLDDEAGFSLVEAMAAITILAVGIFAVAQALTFGLGSTGLSRQKLAARAALDQQMEEARALNYDNLVLSDSSNLTHSTNPNNPDYWVNQTSQTYDPDGSGSMSPEPIRSTFLRSGRSGMDLLALLGGAGVGQRGEAVEQGRGVVRPG